MNQRKEGTGYPTEKDFLSFGFEVYEVQKVNDMGQMMVHLPQYIKNGYKINGGWWTYSMKDPQGKELFNGWWDTVEELEQTLKELSLI